MADNFEDTFAAEVEAPAPKSVAKPAPVVTAPVVTAPAVEAPAPLPKLTTEQLNAPVAARAAAIAAKLPGKVSPVEKVSEAKETAATRRADDAAAKFLAARELRNR